VPAEGNGDLQTLICVLVARPRWCPTLSNAVPWQNWMAAYLGYTLWMKTLCRGWPVMVHDTHTRRRSGKPSCRHGLTQLGCCSRSQHASMMTACAPWTRCCSLPGSLWPPAHTRKWFTKQSNAQTHRHVEFIISGNWPCTEEGMAALLDTAFLLASHQSLPRPSSTSQTTSALTFNIMYPHPVAALGI